MSNDPERPWDAWEVPASQPADEPAPVDPSAHEVLPEDAAAHSDEPPGLAPQGEATPPPYPPVVSDLSPTGEAVAASGCFLGGCGRGVEVTCVAAAIGREIYRDDLML